MATSQEKKELLEELKGPHYYQLLLQGYGSECSYMYISEEAFNFWKAHTDEHGDSDAVTYIMGADDKRPNEVNEMDDLEVEIPREAMFMHDEEDEVGCSWYEPLDEFEHTWGTTLDGAYLTVDKVDSDEYNAKHIEDVIERIDLGDWISEASDKYSTDDEYHEAYVEEHEYGDRYPEKGRYICQVVSAEKGCFFDARITTPGLFDGSKLKFAISEAPNGEDQVWAVEYDGQELDNDGGDTNGKGYYVYFYQQEF